MGVLTTIDEGVLMIASDLHGNREDYNQVRKRFNEMRDQGLVDKLVLLGDIIHAYPGYEDYSVEILDDLIDNPNPDVSSVMGNHELATLYHLRIFRAGAEGVLTFVEDFEKVIEGNRLKYIDFIRRMPYAIRTPGGVTIAHAGPPVKFSLHHYDNEFKKLSEFSHDKFLQQLKDEVGVVLDPSGQPIPRDDSVFLYPIGDRFLETGTGHYWWNLLFNADEFKFDDYQYAMILDRFFFEMSRDGDKQNYLVCGHLPAEEGYATLRGKLLRISTSMGAKDDAHKTLALIDAQHNYGSMDELVNALIPLYD